MSSKHSLSAKILLTATAMSLIVSACGRKGDPIPPPSLAPARVDDLQAVQRGSEIVLRFSYPSATESGLPLGEFEGVEVLRFERLATELIEGNDEEGEETLMDGDEASESNSEVLDGEQTDDTPMPEDEMDDEQDADGPDEDSAEAATDRAPVTEPSIDDLEAGLELLDEETEEALEEDNTPPLPTVDAVTFASLAGVIESLDAEQVGRLVEGNDVVVRLRDETFREEPWVHAYAIVLQANGRRSGLSNIASVVPAAPPPAVVSLIVEPNQSGVEVTWETIDDDTIVGYNVYRRPAEAQEFSTPVATTEAEESSFFDTVAEMGQRWVYAVTAVGARGVESPWGGQREIFYRDIYPPEAPTALVAIPDATGVRLLWRHSSPDDHAGFIVERTTDGATVQLNDDPITALEFTDDGAESGVEHSYQVRAVDRSGNASEPSEPTSVFGP